MKNILLFITLLFVGVAHLQAQGENPYAEFGYEGKVLKTPQERQQYMLTIPNPDSSSDIALVGIAPNEGKYYLFDKDNELLDEDTLMNEELGKFLSVDPLTKGYPWYTPYQFAGNKPIWAIDLDGLEEFKITTRLVSPYGNNQYGGTLQNVAYEPADRGRDPRGEWSYSGVPGVSDGVYAQPQFQLDANIGNMLRRQFQPDNLASNRPYDINRRGQRINAPPPPPPPPIIEDNRQVIVVENDNEVQNQVTNTVTTPPTTASEGDNSTPTIPIEPTAPPPDNVAPIDWAGGSFVRRTDYNINIARVVDWLVDNPSFGISIMSGTGVPEGSNYNTVIPSTASTTVFNWELISGSNTTYGERLDSLLDAYRGDIGNRFSAITGTALSPDRIRTLRNPNVQNNDVSTASFRAE